MSTTRRALLCHRSFLLYVLARAFSELSYQMAVVAVGWQVYAITNSAFDLGMVGLVQFIPTACLTFLAGHVADRYERKLVVQVCQAVQGLTAVFLAWGSASGWLSAWEIFAAVAVLGSAIAFESPAGAALLPRVAPERMLQRATALSSGAFSAAMIAGPALGGVTYAISPGLPYAVMAVLWLVALLLNGGIRAESTATYTETPTMATLFDGVRFVRQNPVVLGSISLDLFAVLFGGATALLPIYARDILHAGPWGLGVLRSAPAVGALAVTAFLARRPIARRVGLRLFQAVVAFGLSTIVFALSHSIWLSAAALAVLGAADAVSMVIRASLVQLATPNGMRGRVSAVNYLFVNASYQLGEFESGITAALWGAVPAAVVGGVGTVAVALLWMGLFPALRKMERLE